jgi:hypothetical protein
MLIRSVFFFCQWLQTTQIGTAIRESVWQFAVIESVHILALVALVGSAVVLDLRLLGIGATYRSALQLAEQLIPVMLLAFCVMAATGILMFWSDPLRFYRSLAFWIKMVLLALAGLNALLFHLTTYRHLAKWDFAPKLPLRARFVAIVSLVLWVLIVFAGRGIAYL